MARNPRADGTKFALEAAAEATQRPPEPLDKLDDNAGKYWPMVIRAKRLPLWTYPDLLIAGQLCRDFAQAESLAREMESEAMFYTDAKGVIRPHPGQRLLEQLMRRIASTVRLLQIHSAATNGPAHHQGGKNTTQRKITQLFLSDDEDLFPTPEESGAYG